MSQIKYCVHSPSPYQMPLTDYLGQCPSLFWATVLSLSTLKKLLSVSLSVYMSWEHRPSLWLEPLYASQVAQIWFLPHYESAIVTAQPQL